MATLNKLFTKYKVPATVRKFLKKRVQEQVKFDPFATQKERERAVIEEYLAELQSEKDNIVSQIEEGLA